MVDAGGEVYLGWFEWIVCWEVDVEEEDSARVGRVVRSHDCCLPVEHIVLYGTSGAICRRVFSEVDELCEFILNLKVRGLGLSEMRLIECNK